MWNNLKKRIRGSLSSVVDFLTKYIAKISIISGLGLVILTGLWSSVLKWIGTISAILLKYLVIVWFLPIWVWFVLILFFVIIGLLTIRNYLYIGKVAGEFYDDFRNGTDKWDYGNEDWKIIDDNGKNILSVGSSDNGGITKKGFDWTDYEFSFETRVIKKASGWIIRAGDRGNFFMVQLNMDSVCKLRPHYRSQKANIGVWMPDDTNAVDLTTTNLKDKIKILEWIKVRILVKGNIVEVYLNNTFAFHYPIDPNRGINIEVPATFKSDGKSMQGTITESVMLGHYVSGGVGFRSAPDEMAHFRNVAVKPI